MHHPHSCAVVLAGAKRASSPGPGAVKDYRAWLQVWRNGIRKRLDGIVGYRKHDDIGGMNARHLPPPSFDHRLERCVGFDVSPQGVANSPAADDEELHGGP
jgi:hypothetical protein